MKKIDQSFYDGTSYFTRKLNIFEDLNNPFQTYRIRNVLRIYTPKKNERVLDLGCGWGTFSFAVAPLVKSVTGVDFSKKSIALCNKKLRERKLKNVRFVCADAQHTGLPARSFDAIISADLFEHLYPDQSSNTMKECARLLTRGGKLAIWTPHRGHFLEILKNHDIILKRDISHVDYKSMDRLVRSLARQGFRILKAYYVESHLPILSLMERMLLPVIPFFRRRIAILAEKS